MADFDIYAPTLKKVEGGFVNNKKDPGGATMSGVTLSTYRKWYGADKTVRDLKAIPYNEWKAIMKGGYWDIAKCDEYVNQSVAEIVADWCVNSGVKVLKNVQKIVGVVQDGIIGPKSLAAINSRDQKDLHQKIFSARMKYYEDIVKKKPSQAIFLRGWMNRLANFTYSE